MSLTVAEGTQITFERPPTSKDELWQFVQTVWGITIPRLQVCDDHVSPFDAFAEGYFGNEANWVLWYGSRGGGKSLLLATLALTKSSAMDVNTVLLGGSLAQSQNVHEHVEKLMRSPNAPRHAVSRQIKTELLFNAGNWVRPIPASQTTVRGPHPHLLCLDEIDEMEKDIYDAAQGQAMNLPNAKGYPVNEMTVASSTWQNPIGTFQEVRDAALLEGLPVRTWCLASGSLVTTARGEVPIEEVTDLDLVLTRQGFRHVQHVTFMGYKPTITLTIGEVELRATEDHLIATESGWRHAGALAADTMSPVLANPRVLGCELVSAATVAGAFAVTPRTRGVDADGHQVQVLDVDAGSVLTQVVDRESVRDQSDDAQPDPAVRLHRGVRGVDALDAVAVALRARPVDAASGEHGSVLSPVWDIGVEDAHEFVVNGILVHNCWREVVRTPENPYGWMDPEFVERKRRSVGKEMFRIEYDLGEPKGGNRAFDVEKVKEYFVDVLPVREHHRANDDMWVFEEPQPTGTYCAAADWAKETDKTSISVFRTDLDPAPMVYQRTFNRQAWPVMVDIFNSVINAYHAMAGHDATGVGNVVNDLVDERVLKVILMDQKRKDLLNEYVADFEIGRYRFPKCTSAYNAHRATTMAMIWAGAATAAHIPDEIISAAIANRVRRVMPPPVSGVMAMKSDPVEPAKIFKDLDTPPPLMATGDVVMYDDDEDGEDIAIFSLPGGI